MNKELLEDIMDGLKRKEKSLEDNYVEVNGITYGTTDCEYSGWEDGGKYQYQDETGRLCSYDEEWNILEKFDIYIDQGVSRSGSYFSDYDYEYINMNAYMIEKILVPEKVIPAHYKDIKVKVVF